MLTAFWVIKRKSIHQIHFNDEITQQQNDLLSNEVTVNVTLKFLFEGRILEKPFTFDSVYVHRSQ